MFYPYWLDSSRCWVVHSWLAHFHCMRGDLWPYLGLLSNSRGETWGGIGGVCYILKRNVTPEGACCGQTFQHCSKIGVFPHLDTSGPNLSLSAYWILSFPIIYFLSKGLQPPDPRKCFSLSPKDSQTKNSPTWMGSAFLFNSDLPLIGWDPLTIGRQSTLGRVYHLNVNFIQEISSQKHPE